MSNHGGSSSLDALGSVETAAAETTRNIVLGLPKDGPVPGSSDAASLQAAEAFIGSIQQEIMACDMANARAMELYARHWWTKVPYFGKRFGSTTATLEVTGADGGGVSGLPACTGTSDGQHKHMRLERSSEVAAVPGTSRGQQQRLNSWFFKLRHPGWVPIIQRPWVPYFCIGCLMLVWTPDIWKLRTLHWCDYQYAEFRRAVHRAYWRATMSAEDYKELMEELERGRPPPFGVSKCPL
ncbi:uncharacterized protein TEOVI_000773900 [Trypanosoma equiperdum]|uniref:Uncharacterized protein n=1 Tax=Trypanosoma equiperdum TaxID=5694 RepID=A0A1G4I4R5_TRYEQ|nr:hypothetical protein, conserved [Trypanosoma equiperdum]